MITFYKLMPVIYTDDLPKGVGGRLYATIILYWCKMRPKYKDDIGIHEHEWTHVKQHFRGLLILHPILYSRWSNYRQLCELEAYTAQLKHSKDFDSDVIKFGRWMATKYDLNLSQPKAIELLRYASNKEPREIRGAL